MSNIFPSSASAVPGVLRSRADRTWAMHPLPLSQRPLRRQRAGVRPAKSQKRFIDIGDQWIEVPQQRKELWPSFEFSKDEAIALQLNALKNNNEPYTDHGVEVMYRFANFDPFERSTYFGRSLDLGQFERFRRVMHSPYFAPLLDHLAAEMLSCFEVGEHVYKQRFLVTATRNEQRVYEITMKQRLGGRYDGYWFTDTLICDEEDTDVRLYGI